MNSALSDYHDCLFYDPDRSGYTPLPTEESLDETTHESHSLIDLAYYYQANIPGYKLKIFLHQSEQQPKALQKHQDRNSPTSLDEPSPSLAEIRNVTENSKKNVLFKKKKNNFFTAHNTRAHAKNDAIAMRSNVLVTRLKLNQAQQAKMKAKAKLESFKEESEQTGVLEAAEKKNPSLLKRISASLTKESDGDEEAALQLPKPETRNQLLRHVIKFEKAESHFLTA